MVAQHRKVLGFVILTLAYRQEGRRWTGECFELGTATYGRSLKEAHQELRELVELHLNALEQCGERQRFFEEHGIRFYTDGLPADVETRVPVTDEESEAYLQAHRFAVGAAA